jgi:hypothetical protein
MEEKRGRKGPWRRRKEKRLDEEQDVGEGDKDRREVTSVLD